MLKKTITDISLNDKRVIMRVDFNVPLDNDAVLDDTRIKAVIPSIEYILSSNARSLILMSHLGRPKGKSVPSMSLAPVAKHLSLLLKKEVKMADNCIGADVEKLAKNLKQGDILMLENLRFYPEEEKNDEAFAKSLASLADIYVNDAFGTTHRDHASTAGIAHYLPSASGFLIEKELKYLVQELKDPAKPFIGIIGGSKVSSKITVLETLLDKVDILIIGGGMSYTFSKAMGFLIGNSLLEEDYIATAKAILKKGREQGVEIIIPVDHIIADRIDNNAIIKNIAGDIPDGFIGVDIGPSTLELIKLKIREAKTVLWNGPLGIFEIAQFANGTFEIAKSLALVDGITIVGGGDSVSAINKSGMQSKVSHISTGGGAAISLIAGNILPGISALDDK